MELERKEHHVPACKTEAGCKIESLAKSPVINRKVNLYINYKAVEKSAPDAMKTAILTKIDLLNDVENFVAAESIYNTYQRIEAERKK